MSLDTAIPVYFELGLDHERIERELDEQLGLEPKPRRERAWDCLAGEAPVPCRHHRIERAQLPGRAVVTCLGCEHEWFEMEVG